MKRGAQIALGLLVSGGLLALVTAGLDLDAAWAQLQRGDLGWLAASAAVSLAVLFARGLRFAGLTSRAGWSDVTTSIAVQNLITRVTPLRLGELSLPYLLHRQAGEPPGHAVVALVLVRLVELWVLLLVAAAAGAAWFGDGVARLGALGVGLLIMTVVLLTFRRWLALAVRAAEWMATKVGATPTGIVSKALGALRDALAEDARLDRRAQVALIGGTLLVAALQFLLFWCLMMACGVRPEPLQLLVGAAAAQVAGALPVISVGSLGTHEAGWTLGFVWVGLNLNDAVLTGLVGQVVTLAFAALFALPAWLRLKRRASGTMPPDGS